jgi:hypothetical protein
VTPEEDLSRMSRGSTQGEARLAEMFLREMGAFRKEMRESLTNLVSREAFQAEKERVNERMGDMRSDLDDERRAREHALRQEAEARNEALNAEKEKRMAVEAEQEKARNRNRWFIGAALIPLAFMLMQYVFDALAAAQGGQG